MTKNELTTRTDAAVQETKTAVQTIWSNINKGQRKQLAKIEEVKAVLERYEIEEE